ncbi:MAG: ABC transporter permease [Porticoccaceae bacterium]|nr:ABC transporter permease [Pseudomonadales bacterium]MCP5170782.1 ABC transporter permease [Pseudomonadales bacterium]MCP5301977.1 ABC transporter permease [Pseudomonadales bacterium]
MKQILTLWMARNREYYRDKGSLFWSFVATPLMVVVLALAFSTDKQAILKVGVIEGKPSAHEALFKDDAAIETIVYTHVEKAITRVQHHQLDILIALNGSNSYWINPESSKGLLLEKYLLSQFPDTQWQREAVSGRKIRYVDWVIPGILAMNMMFSGLWGIGYVIVRYRKNGVLKRLHATPTKAWQFLLSQALSRMVIMVTVTTLVYIGCNLFIDFVMIGSYGLLILIMILGNLSIIGFSLMMAARTASEELANGLLNLISFPMLLLSELWFSLDSAPEWLATLSQWLPLTHIVRAARSVMLEGAGFTEIAPNLAALSAMMLASLIIAATLFRWHKQ